MKKIDKLLITLVSSMMLAGCGNANSEDTHISHNYIHFQALEPTCKDSGYKEYWLCSECDEYTLEKPDGKVVEATSPSRVIEENDDRYLAPDPSKHEMHYIYTKNATLTTDGIKGHYECSVCEKWFDSNKDEKTMDYFKISATSEIHPSIADEILAADAIKSKWSAITNNVSKWTHTAGTNSITVPNNAGWQLSKASFTDLDMKVKIDGCGGTNPDSNGACTKSFIIGGSLNPSELTPGEGTHGYYPIGYLINVSIGSNTANSGIQIYEWTIDKVNTSGGLKLIGRVIGSFNNTYFRIRMQGQVLTLFDANGCKLYIDCGLNTSYHYTCINLDHYYGGSIGIFSWTTNTGTEPTSSTFVIDQFVGKSKEYTSDAEGLVADLLSTDKSATSSNSVISSQASKWTVTVDRPTTIKTNGSYDASSNFGSWKLANRSFNNFRMEFTINGAAKENNRTDSKKANKSILFGAKEKGEYFEGFSLTIYDNGSGDKGLTVKYHDGALTGSLIGNASGDFNNIKLTMVVQNNYIRIYKAGEEVCGGSYWLKRGQGIRMRKYVGGKIGLLNWDSTDSSFTIHSIVDTNDLSNENYADQDPSKRVNVFIFAGQSNMEGNTRAWDNYNSSNYLRNYCNSTNAHNFDELVNGYSNVQISYHNNYVPDNNLGNFSNENDPISGAFLPTKVGQGLRRYNNSDMAYIGPELGFAEKISKVNTSDKPIYIIKFASGGTAFNNPNLNWRSQGVLETRGYLYNALIQYIYNNIEIIRAKGYTPIIRGIVWHQGESDGGSSAVASNYENYLKNFVYDLKSDLCSFAIDNKADNIAFIDAHVNKDSATLVACPDIINNAKNNVAALSTNNFVLDTNATGLNLVTNTSRFGGGDGWHYTADSQIILGNGYADIVINNNMLKF